MFALGSLLVMSDDLPKLQVSSIALVVETRATPEDSPALHDHHQ